MAWMRATHCVLLCASRAAVNHDLSPPQLDSICRICRSILVDFQNLLSSQQWTRLKPDDTEIKRGRQDEWPRVFPHRISSILVKWVIQPIAIVYQRRNVRDAIPRSLVPFIQQAWSEIELAFPAPLSLDTIRSRPMFSEIANIASLLTILRNIIDKAQEQAIGVTSRVSRLQFIGGHSR